MDFELAKNIAQTLCFSKKKRKRKIKEEVLRSSEVWGWFDRRK
ncbi:hypothetical protein GCW_91142 [Mycoplasmoides gallisepticum S6]|uniref:Uncharacterized protein n=1 Tax=Mycoplasmoides gallisepticum S6 TaxID=1006581 RepID=A0A0F6CLV8_MYCGL|nr:hypothetical protein GCW_91142 [Mycoplasmoides gallisepticum S6]